jgi:hypothetical protein
MNYYYYYYVEIMGIYSYNTSKLHVAMLTCYILSPEFRSIVHSSYLCEYINEAQGQSRRFTLLPVWEKGGGWGGYTKKRFLVFV